MEDFDSLLDAPLDASLDASDYKEDRIQMLIGELEQSLLNQCKDMPLLLKKIHSQVQNKPELLHILTEEQQATLVQSILKQTGTEIVSKLSPTQKKKLLEQQVSVEDL